MLVLSRQANESIVLEVINADGTVQEITVALVDIRGKRVRIGINAPDNVNIYRKELASGATTSKHRKVMGRDHAQHHGHQPSSSQQRRTPQGSKSGGDCPTCGYTEEDAKFQNDHQQCPNYPFFSWEK